MKDMLVDKKHRDFIQQLLYRWGLFGGIFGLLVFLMFGIGYFFYVIFELVGYWWSLPIDFIIVGFIVIAATTYIEHYHDDPQRRWEK